MHPLLTFARARQPEIIALIRELVECESPSDHARPSIASWICSPANWTDRPACAHFPARPFGRHLRCRVHVARPAQEEDGEILALGHSDTVWPLGTLAQMPFREKNGRLWGPGVLDMKSGIAFFIFAARALRELEIPVAAK